MPSVAALADQLARFGTDDARLSLSRIRGVSGYVPSQPPAVRTAGGSTGAGRSTTNGGSWAGDAGASGDTSAKPKRSAALIAAAAGALVLAAGGAFVMRGVLEHREETASSATVGAPTVTAAPAEPAPPAAVAPQPTPTAELKAPVSGLSVSSAAPTSSAPTASAKPSVRPAKHVAHPARPKASDEIDGLIGERR